MKGPGPLEAHRAYGPRARRHPYSQRAMVGPGGKERSWIRGARAGSVSDLEALFREHWPRAHRAAYLVVQDAAAAEDIAQEAFLAAVRNLDRFDRRRPFGPWLHRIVVNRAIDWSRRRRLRGVVELRHLLGYTPGQIARLLDLPRGTVNSRLRRGLDELKEQL